MTVSTPQAGRKSGRVPDGFTGRAYGRKAAMLAAAVLTANLAVNLYPAAAHLIDGRTCSAWTWREGASEDIPADIIEHHQAETASVNIPGLPGRHQGVALPGVTLLAPDATERTRAHEAAHQQQMERDGLTVYARRYLSDYLTGRLHGCGIHDAYLAVGYEKEARRAELQYIRQTPPEKQSETREG